MLNDSSSHWTMTGGCCTDRSIATARIEQGHMHNPAFAKRNCSAKPRNPRTENACCMDDQVATKNRDIEMWNWYHQLNTNIYIEILRFGKKNTNYLNRVELRMFYYTTTLPRQLELTCLPRISFWHLLILIFNWVRHLSIPKWMVSNPFVSQNTINLDSSKMKCENKSDWHKTLKTMNTRNQIGFRFQICLVNFELQSLYTLAWFSICFVGVGKILFKWSVNYLIALSLWFFSLA